MYERSLSLVMNKLTMVYAPAEFHTTQCFEYHNKKTHPEIVPSLEKVYSQPMSLSKNSHGRDDTS